MDDARSSSDALGRPRWTWMAALGLLMVAVAQTGIYVVYCRPHTMSPDSPGEDDMWTRLTVT